MKRFDCETDHQAGIMTEYDDGEYVTFAEATALIDKMRSQRNSYRHELQTFSPKCVSALDKSYADAEAQG